MKVQFAHLCDYATVSREGKLSVMGIFSGVRADKFPYRLMAAYLVFELEAEPAELKRPAIIELQCLDQDGGEVFKVKGTMVAPAIAPGLTKAGRRPRINQILGVHGLQLKRPGGHQIHIFVNHDLKHTVEFEVDQVEAGGGPSQGALPPGVA